MVERVFRPAFPVANPKGWRHLVTRLYRPKPRRKPMAPSVRDSVKGGVGFSSYSDDTTVP